MNITNLFQLFASFVQINMWSCFIIFSLIQMTTSFKYDIIKITFSRHFCNFSIKRRVFKQFFFRKHWAITLTKCFHHICIYQRLISDKHFFLVQSVALSFPFKTRLEKCHFFTDLRGQKYICYINYSKRQWHNVQYENFTSYSDRIYHQSLFQLTFHAHVAQSMIYSSFQL